MTHEVAMNGKDFSYFVYLVYFLMCFVCMYVCISPVDLVTAETKRVQQIPWDWSY